MSLPSGDPSHEDTGVDAQSVGELDDVVDADVALTPLDSADVVPVEVRSFCELLLGPAVFFSELADLVPEPDSVGRRGRWHGSRTV